MASTFLGLTGAQIVGTQDFLQTQQVLADLVEKRAMGAIHGDAGLGKTFAVETAMEYLDIESCRVVIPTKASMRRVAIVLLRALTGTDHTGERYRLSDDLIFELSERPRLVVVDEAQNLNHDGVEFLRHIHDDENTCFALALTGGNGCWEVLRRYPMLRSRIWRRVSFQSLSLATVLEVFPSFHPLYAEADVQVLSRIDDEIAHGNFRHWAAFTVDAIRVCADRDLTTVNDAVVDEIQLRMRGQHAA